MGKYLLRINSCLFSDFFHLTPYIAAVHGLSASCHKNGAGLYLPFPRILLKKPAQLLCEKDGPDLSFAVHLCNLIFHRIHRNIGKFRYSYACGAQGLKQKA